MKAVGSAWGFVVRFCRREASDLPAPPTLDGDEARQAEASMARDGRCAVRATSIGWEVDGGIASLVVRGVVVSSA